MSEGPLYSELRPYLDSLVPPRRPIVQEMERYAEEHDFPIVGPASAYFMYTIAKMVKARQVYEMGSGFGYSTAWFAKAVQENGGGVVDHVVWDEELSQTAREKLGELGYPAYDGPTPGVTKIRYTVGEAVEALAKTTQPFDLIFNDIDKEAYPMALEAAEKRLKPGGVFFTDNVIWKGKVIEKYRDNDAQTKAILEFNERITQSDRWDASIIPIRDGIMMGVFQG